ncbi:MAG TPA: branched-chain amino acid ABC transporter permease [Anaerolineaceae bacterium]|nr:MAG: ABC transporter permease [Chloroflexi bacterium GWB2_54_36]HAL16145.1 branched-chain amino acid ABC transporter permease [Anaerolineaceae bacterium]HBA90646.1 branched-chain amino acid ABC transporter permease [Anaerolineaceae bacterium]
MDFELFMQFLINGIALGSLYALIAIGYTIIYGVVQLINFAHGEFFMVAAFITMWGVFRYQIPWYFSFAIAVVVVVGLGLLVDRGVYRPLREQKTSSFIGAISVSFLLQNLFVVLFTSRAKPFPHPEILDQVLNYGTVALPVVNIFIVAVSIILFTLLFILVLYTDVGRAMRAISKDIEVAQLMGINHNRIIAFAFILSTTFAAVGAFMYCSKFPYVDPFTGVIPGLKAFIGAVMGGIGSIPGAMVGGFILGMGEIMIVAFFPDLTAFRDIIAYIILILFLLFRPGGIFNVRMREEKV